MPEVSNAEQSNTATKLSRTRGLRPFRPGPDPRRNLKGRPRTFDQCRAIAQQLAHETKGDTDAITALLRSWRESPEPMLQVKFVEYCFGKVPDKLETTLENKPVLILHAGRRPPENGSN